MVYVDRHVWKGRVLAHAMAPTVAELHAFMLRLPCPGKRFHNKPNRPHYDLSERCLGVALEKGAQLVTTRELLRIYQQYYG